jgi:hypothetical protein
MNTGPLFPNILPLGPQPVRFGWVCPRCHVVHSPDVYQCFCNHQMTWGSSGTAAQAG